MSGTYSCPECGNTEVHGTAWIDMNTMKLTGDDEPVQKYWCPKCDEETGCGDLNYLNFTPEDGGKDESDKVD